MKKLAGLTLIIVGSLTLHAGWQEAQKVIEGDGDGSLANGYSVAMDNGYAVVGAPSENALYVFHKDTAQRWQHMQRLEGSDFSFGSPFNGLDLDNAGFSVDIVAAGSNEIALMTGSPDAIIKYTGTCYNSIIGYFPCPKTKAGSGTAVFELNATSGEFEATHYSPADYNATGHSVSVGYFNSIVGLSGPGQFLFDEVLFASAGYPIDNEVKTFWHLPTREWHEIVTTNTNGSAFGSSVAMDRDASHLIVGDPNADVSVILPRQKIYKERGKAYMYKLEGSYLVGNFNWAKVDSYSLSIPTITYVGTQINEYTHLGQSVDIRGDRAIIGAEVESTTRCFYTPCTPYGGQAIVLTLTDIANNVWNYKGTLYGSGIRGNNDSYAKNVAIEANTAVVSAPTFNGTGDVKGAVYVYDYNGSQWNEEQRIESTQEGNFGSGISIYNDEIMIGNSAHDEVSWYEYHEENAAYPAIIMYLLN